MMLISLYRGVRGVRGDHWAVINLRGRRAAVLGVADRDPERRGAFDGQLDFEVADSHDCPRAACRIPCRRRRRRRRQ